MGNNLFLKFLLLVLVVGVLFGGGPAITLLLGTVGVVVLGIVLVVGLVIFFAFKGVKKVAKHTGEAKAAKQEKTQTAQSAEPVHTTQKTDMSVNELLNKGRRNVMELQMMTVKVKNKEVRSISEEICGIAESILKVLKEQPEDMRKVRQFLNYYLPTLGSILEKYVRLEKNGVPNAELTEKTILHLGEIRTAMQKQYETLFADDILDLSVEMEALTQACRRDGLLGEEFYVQDGNGEIKLTL